MNSIRLPLVAVIALFLGQTDAVEAAQCHGLSVSGKSEEATAVAIANRNLAQAAARGAWEKNCSSKLPSQYRHHCVWDNATRKKRSCSKHPNGLGGYNHSCTFSGRPCFN